MRASLQRIRWRRAKPVEAFASAHSSLRRSRKLVVLLLVLGAVVALAAPACSSSSNPPKAYIPCAQNSDCDTGLICTLGGLCRPKCKTPADCGDGGACVTDNMGNAVCQSKTLNNKPCDTPSDCPA